MTDSCPVCGRSADTGNLYCSLCGVRRRADDASCASSSAGMSGNSGKMPDSEGLRRQVLFSLDNGEAEKAWKYCCQAIYAGNLKDAELVMLEKALSELRQEGLFWGRRPFRRHLRQAGLEDSDAVKERLSRYAKRFEDILVKRRHRKNELDKRKAEWRELRNRRNRYEEADRLMREAASCDDYRRAAKMFEELGEFLDARAKRRECIESAAHFQEIAETRRRQAEEERRRLSREKRAKRLAIIGRGSFLLFLAVLAVAISVFAIVSMYQEETDQLIMADYYAAKGQYLQAAKVYEQHDEYFDLLDFAELLQCEGKSGEAIKVAEHAADSAKAKRKKISIHSTYLYDVAEYEAVKTCLEIASTASDTSVAIKAYNRLRLKHPDIFQPERDYDLRHLVARPLINSGRYSEALPYVRPGDLLAFGKYNQSEESKVGAEEIFWIIKGVALDNSGLRLKLVSLVALDIMPYNSVKTPVTWATCSLRGWLNKDFFDKAFSSREQAAIMETEIQEDSAGFGKVSPGHDTLDKVWIPSLSEAAGLFNNDSDRLCLASEYAFSKNGDFGTKQINNLWDYRDRNYYKEPTGVRYWLRNPGTNELKAAIAASDGSIYDSAAPQKKQIYDRVVTERLAVRPVLRMVCSKSFPLPVSSQSRAKSAGQILDGLKLTKNGSDEAKK